MEGLKPIRKASIKDQVFKQLIGQIVKGIWVPGAKIPSENELAKVLNVSRISVRAALEKLITLGLLEARRGEGTFVREFDSDIYMNSLIPMVILSKIDILQLLEYRKIMEKGTVGLVVDRASDQDIKELDEIISRMKKYKKDDKKFAAADVDFHLTLANLSKNSIIIKVNSIIKDILNVAMVELVPIIGRENGIFYHTKILEAIKDRDKSRAEKLMEEHISVTIEKVSKFQNIDRHT